MQLIQKLMRPMALTLLLLMLTAPGNSETPIDPVKGKIRNALMTRNFSGEYIQTVFRFGRRKETNYRIWVKDNQRLRQVFAPSWQRGEVVVDSDKTYIYYIPTQNAGLKVEKSVSLEEMRLGDWSVWIENLQQVEAGTTWIAGETVLFTGKNKESTYKLWVSRESYLPVGLEVFRSGLMTTSIRYLRIENNNSPLNLAGFIRGDVKWYNNEKLFWQVVGVPRIQPGISFPILQPVYMTSGYSFRWASIEELSSATVALLLYEGPNHQFIALFEREKLSDKQRYDEVALKEAIPGGATVQTYQWIQGQVHLAVIGPVSLEELKKIAASVR